MATLPLLLRSSRRTARGLFTFIFQPVFLVKTLVRLTVKRVILRLGILIPGLDAPRFRNLLEPLTLQKTVFLKKMKCRLTPARWRVTVKVSLILPGRALRVAPTFILIIHPVLLIRLKFKIPMTPALMLLLTVVISSLLKVKRWHKKPRIMRFRLNRAVQPFLVGVIMLRTVIIVGTGLKRFIGRLLTVVKVVGKLLPKCRLNFMFKILTMNPLNLRGRFLALLS